MKISYLSTFYPFRGGIAQFNASLFRQFELNHDVSAFTFTRQYPNILFPGQTQMVQPGDDADDQEADEGAEGTYERRSCDEQSNEHEQ